MFERKREREREREEGDREQGAGKEGEIQREQGRRAKYRRRAKHTYAKYLPRSQNDPVSVSSTRRTPFAP